MEDNRLFLKTTNEKCNGCASDLVFDPTSGKLKCPSCDALTEFVSTKGMIKHPYTGQASDDSAYKAWIAAPKYTKCVTCGAEVDTTKFEITSKCPYCESNYVVEKESIEGDLVDNVIPFAFDKDKIAEKFVKSVKRKFFAPRIFKKQCPKSNIVGIYAPTFGYDMDTTSNYSGTWKKTYKDSKGNTHTKTIHHKGVINESFENLIIEGSDKIDIKQIDSIKPFNFDEAYNYETGFIRGYNTEQYVDNKDKCYGVAVGKVDDAIRTAIKRRHSGDGTCVQLSVSTDYYNRMYNYIFLPIYMLSFKYKNKDYLVVMNGQTGKVGRGLPISPIKVSLVAIFVILILALFIYLIMVGQS